MLEPSKYSIHMNTNLNTGASSSMWFSLPKSMDGLVYTMDAGREAGRLGAGLGGGVSAKGATGELGNGEDASLSTI